MRATAYSLKVCSPRDLAKLDSPILTAAPPQPDGTLCIHCSRSLRRRTERGGWCRFAKASGSIVETAVSYSASLRLNGGKGSRCRQEELTRQPPRPQTAAPPHIRCEDGRSMPRGELANFAIANSNALTRPRHERIRTEIRGPRPKTARWLLAERSESRVMHAAYQFGLSANSHLPENSL